MRRLLAFAVVLALVSPVVADDLYPPDWDRAAPTATFAEFTFDTDMTGLQYIYPEVVYNPFGETDLFDYYPEYSSWYADYEGRQGAAHFYWEFDIDVANHDLAWPYKDIYVQLTWYNAGDVDTYDPGMPEFAGSFPSEVMFDMTHNYGLEGEHDPGTGIGWWYTRYYIHIEPNPSYEALSFLGANDDEMIIDQIVIDTICFPEPASMALLGLGAFALIRRR